MVTELSLMTSENSFNSLFILQLTQTTIQLFNTILVFQFGTTIYMFRSDY